MKTTFTLLAMLVMSAMLGFSQKIDKQKLDFDYIRLPLQPLDKSIKNYSSEVVLAYEADIIAQKKAAQEEYDKEMAEYPQKEKAAEDEYNEAMKKYEADMVEWKEKSTGSKIVEKSILKEDNKPREPNLSKPSEPYLKKISHQKVFNKEMLANSYLKLDGYKKSADNAVKIIATLYGFENLDPELKSKEDSYYNSKTKAKTKVMKYWYEVSYKHPINLKIETPAGATIMDEILEQFSEYTIAKTATTKGSYPSFDKETYYKSLQDKIVESNMKYINEYINSNYGFSKVKQNTIIYRVEAKKLNYDDYQQAFESVTAGYNLLSSDSKSATEKINISIAIWEKALTESKPSDKKARINSNITIITHFNLIEAYIRTNKFSKAEEHINKIVGLNPSKKQKKSITKYRETLKEQKERWEANNS